MRRLAIQWADVLAEAGLNGEHLEWHAKAPKRGTVKVMVDGKDSGQRLSLPVPQSVDRVGVAQSVKVAKQRFQDFDGEYQTIWRDNRSGWETYQHWLDLLRQDVCQQIRSVWKGLTFANNNWFERVCAPAVESALAELVEDRLKLARASEVQRLTEDAQPQADPLSSGVNAASPTAFDSTAPSPADELRALGIAVFVDDEVATRLWAELLRIDAGVRRTRPENAAVPVRKAYDTIAEYVVSKETRDQVLEEMIPQMVFSFASTRPWSRYGKLEFLCSALEPSVIACKAARLEMGVASRVPANPVSPRNTGANREWVRSICRFATMERIATIRYRRTC